MNTKNYSIEAYRFFFTAVIVLHHAGSGLGVDFLKHGYICVEFFFILSGFFLLKSFNKENQHDLTGFVIKRFKRLGPDYWFALGVMMVGIVLFTSGKIDYIRIVLEAMFLQNIGIFSYGGGYNYPCWYLSVLMTGSALIYVSLCFNKKIVLLLSSFYCLIFYTYLFSLPTIENWGSYAGLYYPLWRGIADMLLGCLLAEYSRKVAASSIWYLVELVCFAVVLQGIFLSRNIDSVVVLAMMGLIFVTTRNLGVLSKVLNHRFFNWGGYIAYPMYVNHAFILLLINYTYDKYDVPINSFTPALILVIVIGYSIGTSLLVKLLMSKLKTQ